jgi:hypothetical protein
MRKTVTVLALLLAGAVAWVGLSSSAASGQPSSASDGQRTLHLTQQFGDGFFSLDLGQPGPSGGDVFGGPVTWFDGTKQVATVGFTCTATNVQTPEDLCVLSARFEEGVLTAQTLFEEQSTAPTDWAITGGTRSFRDAAGYLIIQGGNVTLFIDRLG